MAEASPPPDLGQARDWAKRRMDAAVRDFIDRGISASPSLEAKPDWALPFKVVIGRIREHGEAQRFYWAIGGDLPADFLPSSAAATPREAARHFALKWQLDAARKRDANGSAEARRMERAAEALYEIVQNERLWTGPGRDPQDRA